MFTGLVEEVGRIVTIQGHGDAARLDVACTRVLEDTAEGDSIAVNGCCVTVIERLAGGFTADLMGETLVRTALGRLAADDPVNLERAVRAGARLGGHIVQGHVDGVGEATRLEPQDAWTLLTVALPATLAPYVAEKGSIAVDGVSLTVTAVSERSFSVGLIPHTLAATSLGQLSAGDPVNLEVDVLAKYVERMLESKFAEQTLERSHVR